MKTYAQAKEMGKEKELKESIDETGKMMEKTSGNWIRKGKGEEEEKERKEVTRRTHEILTSDEELGEKTSQMEEYLNNKERSLELREPKEYSNLSDVLGGKNTGGWGARASQEIAKKESEGKIDEGYLEKIDEYSKTIKEISKEADRPGPIAAAGTIMDMVEETTSEQEEGLDINEFDFLTKEFEKGKRESAYKKLRLALRQGDLEDQRASLEDLEDYQERELEEEEIDEEVRERRVETKELEMSLEDLFFEIKQSEKPAEELRGKLERLEEEWESLKGEGVSEETREEMKSLLNKAGKLLGSEEKGESEEMTDEDFENLDRIIEEAKEGLGEDEE